MAHGGQEVRLELVRLLQDGVRALELFPALLELGVRLRQLARAFPHLAFQAFVGPFQLRGHRLEPLCQPLYLVAVANPFDVYVEVALLDAPRGVFQLSQRLRDQARDPEEDDGEAHHQHAAVKEDARGDVSLDVFQVQVDGHHDAHGARDVAFVLAFLRVAERVQLACRLPVAFQARLAHM